MTPSQSGSSVDIDAIHRLRSAEVAAAEAGDVETLLELRTDDFVAMPPGSPPVEGLEEVRAFLEGMLGQVEIEEEVVSDGVVVDGDLAYDRGTFTGRARPRAGGDPIPLDGKYLWIAVRGAGGGWKYAVQMWSDNAEPGAA